METKLKEGINWVGYIDWTVRDFHSYNTNRGATYNSYLVQDEKTALIDAVKGPYADHLITNIQKHTTMDKIDYVICNHAEPDHSSGLPAVMKACPDATLVCTEKCVAILSSYYDTEDWTIKTVKSGDTISLGKRTLSFLETPMVHWPDSMFTYVPEEKLLFSMDAFGQHFASSHRFDDEVPLCTVMEEAKKYYANIVMLFGKQIAKVLEAAAGLDIEMIAPSHGVIWRAHIGSIIGAYKNWVECKAKPKVLVVYDTMWKSTAMMAEAIIDGATQHGIDTKLIEIRASNNTEIVTEVLDAAAIAVGSATLNQTLMPAAASTLTYMMGLKPANKCGLAFGSFGWGKGAPEAVNEYLEKMKFDIVCDPIKSKWRPTPEILEECREAGRKLADKAREVTSRKPCENICVDP